MPPPTAPQRHPPSRPAKAAPPLPPRRNPRPRNLPAMLPKPPPRETPPGFLYLPPFRIYGVSIAGEATCIQVPELDVCFDMGQCLRPSLAAKFVAISHGHMD